MKKSSKIYYGIVSILLLFWYCFGYIVLKLNYIYYIIGAIILVVASLLISDVFDD